MKKFSKHLIVTVLVVSFGLCLNGPVAVLAATTPLLGTAATFGILGSTYTNTVAGTTINGDIGYTTGPAVAPTVTGTTHIDDATYDQAGIDQGTALVNLNNQVCTSLGAGAIALDAVVIGANPPGTFPPGCYSSGGAMDITLSTTVTLKGAGTYIFRPNGAFTTGANSAVVVDGASACDVFWTPTEATSFGATTTFIGTVIDAAGITVGANTTWTGRALAYGGTVTTDKNTITVPTCAAASVPEPGYIENYNTLTVIKHMINDGGGTAKFSDFQFFIDGMRVNSGQNVSLAPGIYTVSETSLPNYKATFSGDCDADGKVNHGGVNTQTDVCIITNDDISAPVVPPVPPIIDVIKVPSPLALPLGSGPVTYTYTLRNIGTVPVTDVTMVGDTCSPITLTSGDINTDAKLDLNEAWIYNCSTTLSETHTNTVVATGWANGLTATDIAHATVQVGVPVVPPLIHVTKVPNPLTLSAGGGIVTYTKKVTNLGTVALSNVRVTDDKCSSVRYISGDTDGDSKLDTTETWTYTCQTNLTKTTTNIATATGEANGLTARDFAIATVVVAAPGLPNTGISSGWGSWNVAIFSGILMLVSISFVIIIRKRII